MCVCVCVYLIVDVLSVQGNVDGESGRVVMRPQERLLVRTITYHKVHDGLSLNTHTHTECEVVCTTNGEFIHSKVYL